MYQISTTHIQRYAWTKYELLALSNAGLNQNALCTFFFENADLFYLLSSDSFECEINSKQHLICVTTVCSS
jgi:NADPH-dependent 7-cyano-7-deazaguanine reductase QueF-like protein